MHVLFTCGTGTVCSAIVMAVLGEHRRLVGLPEVPMEACPASEVRSHLDGVAFVAAAVQVPDDLGVPVLDVNALLFREDEEIIATFDRMVDELLG